MTTQDQLLGVEVDDGSAIDYCGVCNEGGAQDADLGRGVAPRRWPGAAPMGRDWMARGRRLQRDFRRHGP